MLKAKVNDIEIVYDENNSEVEEFIKILKKNYLLFKKKIGNIKTISFIKNDNSGVLYLEKPQEFVNAVIKDLLHNNEIFEKISKEEIYIDYLIRKYHVKKNNGFFNINDSISNNRFNEIFIYFIGYCYYKEKNNMDGLINYIKYQDNLEEIFKWFKDKVRFSTFNRLLEEMINGFDDPFINNIEEITDNINNEIAYSNEIDLNQKINLEPISRREMDYLFIKFLDYIKAPGIWYKKYHELKANKRIIFSMNNGDQRDVSKCFVDNNELKILISSDNTIRDLITLVHEFMHYISWVDESNIGKYAIVELPSIFFERVCAEFLVKNGYNKRIVSEVIKERNNDNQLILLKVAAIINLINSFLQDGPIQEEKVIEANQRRIDLICQDDDIKKRYYDMCKKLNISPDVKEMVNKHFDILTKNLIEDGMSVLFGYQYIIGTKITEDLLKNLDDEIIQKMIMLTNDLKNKTLEDVKSAFDIKEFGKRKIK